MFIKIPRSREQLWFAFSELCVKAEAATPIDQQVPPLEMKIDRPASPEDVRWYQSQRRPGRYMERCVYYDAEKQELYILPGVTLCSV